MIIIMLIKRRKNRLFILREVNDSLHCAKFGYNWPSGSGEEFFFYNFVNVFLLFRNYLPLGPFHLNKVESPSP